MALAALPAEGIATFLMPSSTHMETAQESPRALNEPVGFRPSSFTHRSSAPMRAPSRRVRTSGVMPSPSETIGRFGRAAAPARSATCWKGRAATSRRRQRCRMAVEIVADQQRAAAAAEIGNCRRLVLGARRGCIPDESL